MQSADDVDEHVLSTLHIVFRHAGLVAESTAAFAKAWALAPNEPGVGHTLFGCYLRAASFAEAQQLALRMYKSFKQKRYLFWAVCGIVLQADALSACGGAACQPADAQALKLLKLAQAMLTRELPNLDAEQPLHLHLQVLERLGDHEGAIALLDSHGKVLRAREEILRARARLLEMLERPGEAAQMHRTLLVEHSGDDFDAAKGLVRCTLAAAETTSEDLSRLRRDLSKLIEAQPTKRGPRLACVMLEHELRLLPAERRATLGADSASSAAAVVEKVLGLFDACGHKSCCFADLAPYVLALADEAQTLLSGMAARGGFETALGGRSSAMHTETSPAGAPPLDEKALQRFVSYCECRVACRDGLDGSIEDRLQIAKEWLDVYQAHRPLSASLDVRERGHGDALPLIAAEAVAATSPADWVYCTDGLRVVAAKPMVEAVISLEVGRSNSPHNSQLVLALMQGYLSLGATTPALQLYEGLDVKHVQCESLSHTLLPALLLLGATAQAEAALRPVQRFVKHGMNDVAESALLAFQHDNCVQALEFLSFDRTVRSSWWRAMSDVVHALAAMPNECQDSQSALALLSGCASFVNGGLSAADLAEMPDTLDADVVETRLAPETPRGVRKLRASWLPRRALLLKLLRRGLDASGVAELKEIESQLRTACDGSENGESSAEIAGDAEARGECWRSLLCFARFTVLAAQPLAEAETDEAKAAEEADQALGSKASEPDTADREAELVQTLGQMSESLRGEVASATRLLSQSAVFSVGSAVRVAHFAQLLLPLYCAFRHAWRRLLPQSHRKKEDSLLASAIRDLDAVCQEAAASFMHVVKTSGATWEAHELVDASSLVGDASEVVASLCKPALPSVLSALKAGNASVVSNLEASLKSVTSALRQVSKPC